MVVGDQEDYLAVLLTLQTKIDSASNTPGKELTEEAKKWFRNARLVGIISNSIWTPKLVNELLLSLATKLADERDVNEMLKPDESFEIKKSCSFLTARYSNL